MYAIPVVLPVVGAIVSSFTGGKTAIRNKMIDVSHQRRVEADRAVQPQQILTAPILPVKKEPLQEDQVINFDTSAGRSSNGMGAQSVSQNLIAWEQGDALGMPLDRAFTVKDETLKIGGQGYDNEQVLSSEANASGGQTIARPTGGYIGTPLRSSRGLNDLGISRPSKVSQTQVTVDEFYGERWMPNRLPPHSQASYLREAQEQKLKRFQGQTTEKYNELGQSFASGDEMLHQRSRGYHTMARPQVAHRTQTMRGTGDQMGDPDRTISLPRVFNPQLGEFGENTLTVPDDAQYQVKDPALMDRVYLVNYGLQRDVAERESRLPSAGQSFAPIVHPDVAERTMRKIENRERSGWTDATSRGQASRPENYLPRLTRKLNAPEDLVERVGGTGGPSQGAEGLRQETAESYEQIRARTMKKVVWAGELSGHAAISRNVHADASAEGTGTDRTHVVSAETIQGTRINTAYESQPMIGMKGKGAMSYAQEYEIQESTRPVLLVSGDRYSDPTQLASLKDNPLAKHLYTATAESST